MYENNNILGIEFHSLAQLSPSSSKYGILTFLKLHSKSSYQIPYISYHNIITIFQEILSSFNTFFGRTPLISVLSVSFKISLNTSLHNSCTIFGNLFQYHTRQYLSQSHLSLPLPHTTSHTLSQCPGKESSSNNNNTRLQLYPSSAFSTAGVLDLFLDFLLFSEPTLHFAPQHQPLTN